MKRTLLLVLAMSGVSAVAQTPRLSLYEEFTGETCPPCAATNPGLNAILLNPVNQQKIVAIKWQVPIPSAPTKTWSLYQTNKAEIDWRYRSTASGGYGYPSQNTSTNSITSGINSAPSGRIDGQHQWAFNATSDHPFYMSNAVINTAQSYTSAFSIIMTRAWDVTASAVNLTVNITASAPFTAVGNLVFRCVMVEREISFAQQPGTNGEKFFEDVAVKSFPTLQNGTALAGTWTTSQNMTFTLNCPLPSYIRDKSQVAFVGFIQDDGDRKVAQAVRADVDPLVNDAKAIAANVPDFSCGTSVTPQLQVDNVGTNAITALTITPYLDGIAQPDFNWVGNINPAAGTNIMLNPISPALPGGHVLTFSITGVSGGDINLLNNTAEKDFYLASSYPAGSPVVQAFSVTSFPGVGYSVLNTDAGASWARHASTNGTTVVGGTGTAKYDFFNNGVIGDQDELLLPPVGFTLAMAPKLTFDVAYCQYDNSYNDKLEVKVSKDCGNSWSTVYSKQGSTLSTKVPQTSAFTPGSSHWRNESVTLTGFGNSDVIVKFVTTSDYGNNLYLDNINLSQQCVTQNVNVISSQTAVCLGDVVTMTASGANSFNWSNSQTGNQITVVPSVPGNTTFIATSTDPDACGDSFTVSLTVSNCVGVNGQVTLQNEVYPNPNNGEFVVKAAFEGKAQLTMYNKLGQKVHEQVITGGSNTVKTDLPAGMYLYTITGGENISAKGSVIVQ